MTICPKCDGDAKELNVLLCKKPTEVYVFIFTDDRKVDACYEIGRAAGNTELDFSWSDAKKLLGRIQKMFPSA